MTDTHYYVLTGRAVLLQPTTCSVTFSQLAAVDLLLEIAIKTNTEYYVDSVCQVN